MLRCGECNKPQTFAGLIEFPPSGYYADGADPSTFCCPDCCEEIVEPLLMGLINEEVNREYLQQVLEEVA